MGSAGILGTGAALPEKVITNQDLEKLVETSDQWIVERTGIKERRQAAPEETTSSLSVKASRKALDRLYLLKLILKWNNSWRRSVSDRNVSRVMG